MTDSAMPSNQTQLLTAVLDSSLDGIMLFKAVRDREGKIVDFIFEIVNKKSEQIVGRRAEDLLGDRLLNHFPDNVEDGLFDAYINVTETGDPFYTEHHYAHDGLDLWFSISATRCGDGFTVTFGDITARKVGEERFRILFEHSTNAHLLFDETGIIDCN